MQGRRQDPLRTSGLWTNQAHMCEHKQLPFYSAILVLILVASLPGCSGVTSNPSQNSVEPLQTQVARVVVSTLAAYTVQAVGMTATRAAMPTSTPDFTFTPSLTPTATLTPTPSVPMVRVSATSNCRTGPTTAYNQLGVFHVGETAQVVGRSIYSDTWIVQLPSNPAITCWLWAGNATVVGDTSKLPVIPLPSTPTPLLSPTPLASFDVLYSSTVYCSGVYQLNFKITNTGGLTWESNRIIAEDLVTYEAHHTDANRFPNVISDCSLANNDQNLEAGEIGNTTSAGFSTKPGGHPFSATLLLCSQDGMAGTCIEKTITFKP
jgi:hypothetical protein